MCNCLRDASTKWTNVSGKSIFIYKKKNNKFSVCPIKYTNTLPTV